MIYGYNKTIHGTQHLDIEIDKKGNVVSVWFRCSALPFRVTKVDNRRAIEMVEMSAEVNKSTKLNAVDLDKGKLYCLKPPVGWYCTREGGHSGPCAAWLVGEPKIMS